MTVNLNHELVQNYMKTYKVLKSFTGNVEELVQFEEELTFEFDEEAMADSEDEQTSSNGDEETDIDDSSRSDDD